MKIDYKKEGVFVLKVVLICLAFNATTNFLARKRLKQSLELKEE